MGFATAGMSYSMIRTLARLPEPICRGDIRSIDAIEPRQLRFGLAEPRPGRAPTLHLLRRRQHE